MKNSRLQMFSMGVLLATALAGCGGRDSAGDAAGGDTKATKNTGSNTKQTESTAPKDMIVVGLSSDVPTLDPALTEDNMSSRVEYDLFEGLTSFDQKNEVVPGLAEKWALSPDLKTYTFHLRPNLKFSDGSPITAEDVVYSYRRVADPATASPYANFIENLANGKKVIEGQAPVNTLGVRAVDSATVQVTLETPDPAFCRWLHIQLWQWCPKTQ